MDLYQYAVFRCKADSTASPTNDKSNQSRSHSKTTDSAGIILPVVYRQVCVNAQSILEHIHAQVLEELHDCLLELCNGAFTFDYSYHLSRNVQARMKKLRFQKKNIEQNIQDFVKCFSQDQIEATIVEEVVQRIIYGVRFSYQHRFNTADSAKDDDYQVTFFFDDLQTAQLTHECNRRRLAERVWDGLQQFIARDHYEQIKKERSFELKYSRLLHADLYTCYTKVKEKMHAIIAQARSQDQDPQHLDIYTRILRKAAIITKGRAYLYIPEYIRLHTPTDSKGIVVVDWSEQALLRLLAARRYLFVHNGEEIISIRKFIHLLQDVFYIKEPECFHLAILFNIVYGSIPMPAVISACGSPIAQHCYMFARYFKERSVCHLDRQGNAIVNPASVIRFLAGYIKIEDYMNAHQQQFSMFDNMGSLLMFKKREFGRLALVPSHYFANKPRPIYRYKGHKTVRFLAESYFWLCGSKSIQQQKQPLSENDIQAYLSVYLSGMMGSLDDCVWLARPPTIKEIISTTPSPSSYIPRSNHLIAKTQLPVVDLQETPTAIATAIYDGNVQVPQTVGLFNVLQLDFTKLAQSRAAVDQEQE